MEERDPNSTINEILDRLVAPPPLGQLSIEQDSDSFSAFDIQLENLFDQFASLITSERSQIEAERKRLSEDRLKFEEDTREDLNHIQEARAQWELFKAKAEQQYAPESNILEINVGGATTITTTRSTLMKVPNSTLAAVFSGRHPISYYKGRAFVDRDPQAFCDMIYFLRTEKLPSFKSVWDESCFFDELEFWGIPLEFDTRLDESPKQFDALWCAPSVLLDSNQCVLRKSGSSHGIAFGSKPMSSANPYIEFRVSITTPSSNGSHIFVGLVDKSTYSPSQLVSTLWRDAPSSWYWDVWSCKLIRTDENGVHSVVAGYGCDCEDEETVIGIHYNPTRKTISYFKNDIDQGVAFTNVPSGLFPSIDLWFHTGSVAILQTQQPKTRSYL
jgi:hypothetical protein